MHRCVDCKIVLDNDVRFCPQCGKSVDSGPDPLLDVPKLLAAASLHKSRAEWDEAMAAATDALRMEPKNPDVAVALAGIYEEQDLFDEALVWYQMALELDPECPKGKAGRDRIGMLVTARRRGGTGSSSGLKKRDKQVLAILGIALLAALITVAIVASKGHHSQALTPSPTARPQPSANPPIAQPWARRPVAERTPAEPLSGVSTPMTAAPAPSLRTTAENAIKSGLSSDQSVTTSGASIDDVIADPRTGLATVTFSLPLKGIVTRDQIARAVAAVARKTFELHPAVRSVTVRCVVQVAGSQGAQIAFVGDIAREGAPSAANDQQVAAAFRSPWWNPLIGK